MKMKHSMDTEGGVCSRVPSAISLCSPPPANAASSSLFLTSRAACSPPLLYRGLVRSGVLFSFSAMRVAPRLVLACRRIAPFAAGEARGRHRESGRLSDRSSVSASLEELVSSNGALDSPPHRGQ